MATKTTNYSLVKPAQEDYYDVGVFNGNADIIDNVINCVAEDLTDSMNRLDEVEAGLSNIVHPKAYNIIIAANDTPNKLKKGADYVCDDENDLEILNTAIASLTGGGCIKLLPGNYNLINTGGSIAMLKLKNKVTLSGSGSSTILDIGNKIHILSTGVVIENMTINATSVTDAVFLTCNNGDNYTTRNCWINIPSSVAILDQSNGSTGATTFMGNYINYIDYDNMSNFLRDTTLKDIGYCVLVGNIFTNNCLLSYYGKITEAVGESGNINLTVTAEVSITEE